MGITFNSESGIFHIFTHSTSYQILLYRNTYPLHLYWGHRVYDDSCTWQLEAPYRRARLLLNTQPDDGMFSREYLPFEYPCYGTSDFRTPAYDLTDSQGCGISDPRFVSWEIVPGKPPLDGLPSSYCDSPEEAQTLILTLRDPVSALQLELFYTAFEDSDVITRHTRLTNGGQEPVQLNAAASMSLDMKHGTDEMIQLCGTALRETHIEKRGLGTGITAIESLRGISSHQANPFAAFVNRDTTETQGEAFALSLVYSGNFRIQAEKDMYGSMRLQAGINPCHFRWQLAPGSSFTTPEALLVYSGEGLGTMSRCFHRFMRRHIARGEYRDAVRPVLLNTWEAFYFSFQHDSVLELARTAKKAGVELLVLDDGWFGHRDDDRSSLGDWYPDKKKLPRGIRGLCEDITAMGLKMGLWFEPEMISPDSDLYRAHPDWCLHVPGRKRTQWRSQLVLDMGRADVQQYLIDTISQVLGSCELSYVKWDCNRRITEAGSAALPPQQQGEVMHRYVLGLYAVIQALTERFPHILFENCASGGARFDPGMMCYFSQNWASDNTDAVSRLKIQYGASLVYPPVWITSHISASPNHQLDRPCPLQFREHVCQSFNLGYELDLLKMQPEELSQLNRQIETYKQLRAWTQFGDFYRIKSPFDGPDTAWMISAEEGKHILVWYFKPYAQAEESYLGFKLAHLDEQASYRLVGTDKIYHGSALMHMGLPIDWKNGDHFSQFWHFEKI